MPGIDSGPADREPGMVHLALQKRGLAGLGALLLANLQAFGERPLPRNFGLDPVRLLLAAQRRMVLCLRSTQNWTVAPDSRLSAEATFASVASAHRRRPRRRDAAGPLTRVHRHYPPKLNRSNRSPIAGMLRGT